ncbi:MAG: M28 family peptidase [Clostridia bacterium]|nr:M28 family peptidase [Clostridia bacterium]
MNKKTVAQILKETSYVRMGGTPEELKTAEYLAGLCERLGVKARLESFEVQMGSDILASLCADGKEIPCRGYRCCADADLTAPLVYLPDVSPASLAAAKDSVVLLDSGFGYFLYHDLVDNGARGVITYDGGVFFEDSDVDLKELRDYVACGDKLPAVSINAKDALALVKNGVKEVSLKVSQKVYQGSSQNVIAEIEGKNGLWITFTAHYDSTALSVGSYDNMSGCIGLLVIMEALKKTAPHSYGLRFIFCGSEERGLLGAKAYVKANPDEIALTDLDINLDMIGTYMGKFCATCSAENDLAGYLRYMGAELSFPVNPRQGVHSSDSTPFADAGVPSVTFVRRAPVSQAMIHNRYDTRDVLSEAQIIADGIFVAEFARRMADSARCPVSREIPESVKTELDEYLFRKRKN